MGRRHNPESAAAQAEELLRLYHNDDDEESRVVDPRLVPLLQYFRELYVEKREIFDKIFPEELGHDMLKKMGAVLGHVAAAGGEDQDKKVKFQTRSLSLHSPPRTAGKGEADQPMRLERFKVKTFDVKGGQGGGATK